MMMTTATTPAVLTTLLVIDAFVIVIGIFSLVTMWRLKTSLGGRVGEVLTTVIWGVFFNTMAVVWTLAFMHLRLFPEPPFDAHHILMSIGMVMFVLAARKFSSLVQQ